MRKIVFNTRVLWVFSIRELAKGSSHNLLNHFFWKFPLCRLGWGSPNPGGLNFSQSKLEKLTDGSLLPSTLGATSRL